MRGVIALFSPVGCQYGAKVNQEFLARINQPSEPMSWSSKYVPPATLSADAQDRLLWHEG